MSDKAIIPKDEVIDTLEEEWQVLAELGDSLSAEDWDRPTACPGWSARDNLSHIIGTERLLAGEATPDVALGDTSHVRNAIGETNEAWVAARRGRPGAEVVAELREVAASRVATLRAMSEDDWNREGWTPAGTDTFGRFMQIRVMDCWVHEQDIREAVDRPGHISGRAPA
jgi:uncharacterized protein (TIGR03083 family)